MTSGKGDSNSKAKVPQIQNSTQWSKDEDIILKERVEQFGTQNWVIIARYLPNRLGR